MSNLSAICAAALIAMFGFTTPAVVAQDAGTVRTDFPTLVKCDSDRTDISYEGIPLNKLDDIGVYTKAGEHVGEVDGAHGDASGQVRAVSIEIQKGFLGLNGYEVMIPVQRLTLDKQQNRFIAEFAQPELEALQKWSDD